MQFPWQWDIELVFQMYFWSFQGHKWKNQYFTWPLTHMTEFIACCKYSLRKQKQAPGAPSGSRLLMSNKKLDMGLEPREVGKNNTKNHWWEQFKLGWPVKAQVTLGRDQDAMTLVEIHLQWLWCLNTQGNYYNPNHQHSDWSGIQCCCLVLLATLTGSERLWSDDLLGWIAPPWFNWVWN